MINLPDGFKGKVKFTYIAVLHFLLIVMLVKSDFLNQVYKTLGGTIAQKEVTQSRQLARASLQLIEATAGDGRLYIFGDSHLKGLDVNGIIPRALQLSIGGDTAATLSRRIGDYRGLEKATGFVIAIGQNDLHFRDPEEVRPYIVQIMSHLPRSRPVLMFASLPVDENTAVKTKTNVRIRELNAVLYEICEQYPECTATAAPSVFLDQSGNASPKYFLEDGVHLSLSGMQQWSETITAALKQQGLL